MDVQVLRTVEASHNLFFSGMGGTGKSLLVKGINRKLGSCGRKLVVCTSTIACSVYEDDS